MAQPMTRPNSRKEPLDDREILARLKAGDMSACTACVEAHSDGLYRLAYRLLSDEAAAEDVVQETFINAFKGLDRFEGRASLSTWLFRIAYNNALMRLRARRPAGALDEEVEESSATVTPIVVPWRETPEEALARRETREVLDEAVDSLPTSLRAVFQLRDVEERSTAETAEILGLTEAAVKVRLHRARLALRERLGGYFGERVQAEEPTMTCEQLVQYLSDYIDHELDEPLAQAARNHLATCHHCHILLDTTQDTITLYREREKRVIPAASRSRLFREIESSFSKRSCD